jgi:outer membrane protein TolC
MKPRSRYAVGSSTTYRVMQAQSELAAAQDLELTSMVAWNSARVALDETRGLTLEANHISIAEAKAGQVAPR